MTNVSAGEEGIFDLRFSIFDFWFRGRLHAKLIESLQFFPPFIPTSSLDPASPRLRVTASHIFPSSPRLRVTASSLDIARNTPVLEELSDGIGAVVSLPGIKILWLRIKTSSVTRTVLTRTLAA